MRAAFVIGAAAFVIGANVVSNVFVNAARDGGCADQIVNSNIICPRPAPIAVAGVVVMQRWRRVARHGAERLQHQEEAARGALLRPVRSATQRITGRPRSSATTKLVAAGDAPPGPSSSLSDICFAATRGLVRPFLERSVLHQPSADLASPQA
jgi:hypothetical protein